MENMQNKQDTGIALGGAGTGNCCSLHPEEQTTTEVSASLKQMAASLKKNESYYQLDLVLDDLDEVNYALVQSRQDICRWCVADNSSDAEIPNLQLAISGDYLETFTSPLYYVGAHQKVRISDINICMKVHELARLTERILSNLILKVVVGDQIVYEDALPISLMAYDQWLGIENQPILSSFVTSNYTCISSIILRASRHLMESTSDAS